MNISPIPSMQTNVAGNAPLISETPVDPGARAGRRRSQPEGMPSPRGAAQADSPNAEPHQVLGSGLPIELHAEVARHVLDVTSNRDIASICRTAQAYDEAMPRPKKGHEPAWRDWLNPTQRQILSALKQRCTEAEAYVNSAAQTDCDDFVLDCRLFPWISPEARSRLVRLLVSGAKQDRFNESGEGLHEIFRHHALLDETAKEDLIDWLNPIGSTGALTVEQQCALDALLSLSSAGKPFCDHELAMRIGDFEQHLRHHTSDWPPVQHWAFHLRPAARHEIIRSAFAEDPIRISGELIVLFSDMDEAQRDSLVSDLVSHDYRKAGLWLSSLAAQSGLLSQKAKDWILGWTATGANKIDFMEVRRVRAQFAAQRKDAKFEESLVAHALTDENTKQKLGALVHCCESLRGSVGEVFMRGLCEVFDKFEPADIIRMPRRWDDEDEVPIALWAGVGGALYTELVEPEKTRFKSRVEELARGDSGSMSSTLAGLAPHLVELDNDFVESLLLPVLEPDRAALEGHEIAQFYDGILPHFSRLSPVLKRRLREHMLSISVVDWVHSDKGSDVLLDALVRIA